MKIHPEAEVALKQESSVISTLPPTFATISIVYTPCEMEYNVHRNDSGANIPLSWRFLEAVYSEPHLLIEHRNHEREGL